MKEDLGRANNLFEQLWKKLQGKVMIKVRMADMPSFKELFRLTFISGFNSNSGSPQLINTDVPA